MQRKPPMRARDDLIAAFFEAMRGNVAEATELWLGYEEGKVGNLAGLRRLLHTVKGEAQMLGQAMCGGLAEQAESVVDLVRKVGEVPPLAGDALLGAFEGMGIVATPEAAEDPPDLEPIYA